MQSPNKNIFKKALEIVNKVQKGEYKKRLIVVKESEYHFKIKEITW